MPGESRYRDFISFIEDKNRDPYGDHEKTRYIETFNRLQDHISPNCRILELGDYSAISLFLRKDGSDISVLTDDLRYSFDLPSDLFDVVLSLEVVEHLKDTHSSQRDLDETTTFTFSGVNNMFRESFRVLKFGGYLCVTTPNACSADAIGRTLLEMHPYHREPHVREFTAREVVLFGENNGFEVELVDSFDAWPPVPNVKRERVRELIEAEGFSNALRGNCLFVLFQKSSRSIGGSMT